MPQTKTLYGVAARYDNTRDLIEAASSAKNQGFSRMETYTPFPVDELDRTLGYRERLLPWMVFAGGMIGGLSGFLMQYWANVWFLPLDIGGRPYNSWPAFIPITFELAILFAAIFGFVGVIIRCGLPQIYHSMFNVSSFEKASQDGFFLCITADDPRFELSRVSQFLKQTNAKEITNVEI